MFTSWWKISPMASLYHPATRAVTWSENIHAQTHSCNGDPKARLSQKWYFPWHGTHNRRKKPKHPPLPVLKITFCCNKKDFQINCFLSLTATNDKGEELNETSFCTCKKKKKGPNFAMCLLAMSLSAVCFKHIIKGLVLPAHSSRDVSAIVRGQNHFHAENSKHTVSSLYQLKTRFIVHINKAYESTCISLFLCTEFLFSAQKLSSS